MQGVARRCHRMERTKWAGLALPCARPTGMEKSDPVNGWPQRAISLWDMMMIMIITHTGNKLQIKLNTFLFI